MMPHTRATTDMTDPANQTLTIIADSNIASLEAFFNPKTLEQAADGTVERTVNIIEVAGREIDAQLLAKIQPEVLLIRSVTPINAELLADNRSVQFVGSATIGTDHVDQDYLAERGITFANAAGCSKHSVAQYVLTAALTLRPEYWAQAPSIGIIGLGNIGSTLAQYAQDLGWHVRGYDPLLPTSAINNASFDEVIGQSEIISLHVPLTNHDTSAYPTRHLIDAKALAAMRPDALLVNSARGAVVAAQALEDECNKRDSQNATRHIVLDVFEHEPQVSESLLSTLAIATPHIAGYTLEGKLRGTQMIYDALCEHIGVAPTQTMHQLLPENLFLWSELRAHPEKLSKYYDIMADDAALRAQMTHGAVSGAAFDQLRREYHLRREWQRDT